MLLDIDKHVNILILSADSDLSDPRAGVFAGRRNILWDGRDLSQPSFGTGRDIFIPLFLLDQILPVDFFSKISKLIWRCKFTSIELF